MTTQKIKASLNKIFVSTNKKVSTDQSFWDDLSHWCKAVLSVDSRNAWHWLEGELKQKDKSEEVVSWEAKVRWTTMDKPSGN